MPDEKKELQARYVRYQTILREMTLMSDAFMRNVLKVTECAEYVLQVILEKPDLRVVDVVVQKDHKNLQGRSAVLDCVAQDADGNRFDIEVQQDNEGASPKRARFHSGLLDMNTLNPSEDFEKLPESYVIFITRNDVLGGGLPIYHVERTIRETGDAFADRAYILYVTASIQEDTELGRLMHDFHCKNADEMYSKVLADRVRALKETPKGVDNMCRELEELYLYGEKRGIEKGVASSLRNVMEKGVASSLKNVMAALGLSVEAAMDILRIPEDERANYMELLAKQ